MLEINPLCKMDLLHMFVRILRYRMESIIRGSGKIKTLNFLLEEVGRMK